MQKNKKAMTNKTMTNYFEVFSIYLWNGVAMWILHRNQLFNYEIRLLPSNNIFENCKNVCSKCKN